VKVAGSAILMETTDKIAFDFDETSTVAGSPRSASRTLMGLLARSMARTPGSL